MSHMEQAYGFTPIHTEHKIISYSICTKWETQFFISLNQFYLFIEEQLFTYAVGISEYTVQYIKLAN